MLWVPKFLLIPQEIWLIHWGGEQEIHQRVLNAEILFAMHKICAVKVA